MSLADVQSFATSANSHLVTLGFSVVSGLVPFVNIEAFLLAVATLTPAAGWPVVLITTLGQMIAKIILYLAGKHGVRPLANRFQGKLERAERALHQHKAGPDAVVAISALSGFPPFYGVSVIAGAMRFSLTRFLLIATPMRLIRFALVFFAPRVFKELLQH